MRIYSRVLTATDVQELYSYGTASCPLPWGGTIVHQQSVTAYQTSSGPCTSEARTCTDGSLSGTYTYQSCADTSSNLIGHWKFDETSGTVAADSAGGDNNADLWGGFTFANRGIAAGAVGRAFNFDGNSVMPLTSYANLNVGTGNFTVCFWMKGTGSWFVFSKGEGDSTSWWEPTPNPGHWAYSSDYNYSLYIQGGAAMSYYNNDQSTYVDVQSAADTNWNLYCMRKSGTTAYYYKNGTLKGSASFNVTDNTNYSFVIGGRHNQNTGLMDYKLSNAYLDDMRLYSRALSPADITELFEAGSCADPWGGSRILPQNSVTAYQAATGSPCVSQSRTCVDGALTGTYTYQSCADTSSNLVGHWQFEETTGQTTADSTATNNVATGYNANAMQLATTTGKIGNAIDGSTGYTNFYVGDLTGIPVGSYVSVCYWAQKLSGTSPVGAIIERGTTNPRQPDWGVYMYSSGGFGYMGAVGNGGTGAESNVVVSTDSNWHHYCVVEGISGSRYLRFYRDGVFKQQKAITAAFGSYTKSQFCIGGQWNLGGSNQCTDFVMTNMKLDDLRLYSRTLSDADVLGIYQIGAGSSGGGSCPTLGSCTTAGEIDYDSGSGVFKYCNGTDWKSIGTGTTSGSCTSSGELEYDAGATNYKFCNGSNWITVANAGTLTGCTTLGEIEYDSGASKLKWCNGANWIDMTCTADCPNVGNTCADGSIYIGLNGAGKKVYATTAAYEMTTVSCDAANTYSNDTGICPGGTPYNGIYWSYAASNSNTGADSTSDGLANQNWIAANESINNHPIFRWCAQLSAHGKSDWYVPAKDELNLFWNGGSPLAGVNTAGYWYHSSTEGSTQTSQAWRQKFNDGTQLGTGSKASGESVRCVRHN